MFQPSTNTIFSSQIDFSSNLNPNRNILIIDDSPTNLNLLSNFLTEGGFNVLLATNGEEAIDRAETVRPDIILLDVVMPGINGFETCRRLKENELTKNIPVIFMTALSATEDRVKGFEMGAVDYITKPIHEAEVLARVTTHLTIQNLQNQLKEQNMRLQQQMVRERLITTMQERIRQSLNLEEILGTTVNEVRDFLQTDRALVYQFKANWSGVVVVESVSPNCKSILQEKIIDPCFGEKYVQFYQQGKTKAIADIYTHGLQQCYIDLLAKFEVKANLIVPIRQGEKLWGLLIIHHCSSQRQWQIGEIEPIQQLVTQVGIAIQQAQLYQKLKIANQRLHRLASLDSLTQLANRRQFNAYLNEEWRSLLQKQSKEPKSPLSLILCDVDFFKLYNDTYGHLAGDCCLQQIARAIESAVIRNNALVARYGGEELAVILPNAKAEDAACIAERIRKTVKSLKIAHAKSPISQYVTLSLGVSTIVPKPEYSSATLIAAADRALYRAKEQGRDRFYTIGCDDPIHNRE